MPHIRSRSILAACLAIAVVASVVPVGGTQDALAGTLLPGGRRTDVVVYGGTPGGILAAVTAARAGRRVVLVEPTAHLGGMMSSGLGWTDIADRATLGGYTLEFFTRVGAVEGTLDGRWHFQPSTAEGVFEDMLDDDRITVVVGAPLHEANGVAKVGSRITSIRLVDGRVLRGAVFIDASYEGDLMAQAGVTYRLGRESTAEYGESRAGVRPASVVVALPPGFDPGFPTAAPGPVGSADDRIQASNYRICFSSDPGNQVPFAAPDGYDPATYEVILENIAARLAANPLVPPRASWFLSISPLANQKFDVNDFGALSTAIPGLNHGYPELSYAERAEVDAAHRAYDQGLIHFLANDPNVPIEIRNELSAYGLCADEFTDNDNWPWLLYLREGRRMVGSYVLRQRDIDRYRYKLDGIGVASYRSIHTTCRAGSTGRDGSSPRARWAPIRASAGTSRTAA